MAEAKVSLHDQVRGVERVADEVRVLYEASGWHKQYPQAAEFDVECLRAAARTLAFMQAHEQTIRDAISSARTVDDTQDTR